ncbi:hypothetical protein GCM10009678_30330 [Actinomadura kijaniata]|uniref:Protein-S-isoprenylcysteine O-methyltransferase Ste14 n=1 Tax=Actinomadura namibiensis TaxID=182080 RepID=A0A7W3QLZ1_ACTNM|nr:hypothetical protein [Actinomadura namibiensis]MBA8952002.1 protein-S-isoprenylcysteine O-methyltransferase Ste14 [Actinomadura namibiensis]
MRVRATCVRWALGTATACAGAAAVAVAAPVALPPDVLRATLASAAVVVLSAAVWAYRDLRARQRRILRHMETQTRVLHSAARAAGRLEDR